MKSFALEKLDSEIFEEKSKHNKFGKTEYKGYSNSSRKRKKWSA